MTFIRRTPRRFSSSAAVYEKATSEVFVWFIRLHLSARMRTYVPIPGTPQSHGEFPGSRGRSLPQLFAGAPALLASDVDAAHQGEPGDPYAR
ncbi:hypothetical protein GCM10010273_39330 [Streptomyces lavendulocolor]